MGLTTPNKLNGRRRKAEGGRRITIHYPLSTIHYSPTPEPRTPIPAFRPAFTLIELLIVISIMLILVTLTATMMRPDVEGRRVREATRAINVYLASARNRAMETGRPCGVIFRAFGAVPCAMNADQCEVPPSYCGETEDSAVRIQATVPIGGIVTVTATFEPSGTFNQTLVLPNDSVQLIQFNGQGPFYQITAANDITLTAECDVSRGQMVPWPVAGWSQPVPYRIFRAPIKGFAQPLQLPAATVVDLGGSGVGNNYNWGANDVTILFSPNGAVESVNGLPVVDPIFLLVGKREKVPVGTVTVADPATWPNWCDLTNLWVTINPQTGSVMTGENFPIDMTAPDWTDSESWGPFIFQARTFAREALGMGGK